MTDTAKELEGFRTAARKAGAAMDAFGPICEGFLKASGMRVDAFGFAAANRADFMHSMRKGKDFRRSSMRKVLAFIEGGPHTA